MKNYNINLVNKPKQVVVDEYDNIIATKNRKDINYETDIFRTSALWITNTKGEILLARRAFNKPSNPGRWGPAVAGTLDEGEDYDDSVYKEAEEELGITGIKFQKAEKSFLNIPPFRYFVQWYTVTIDKPLNYFKPQEEEVVGLTWIDAKILINEVKETPNTYITGFRESIMFLIKQPLLCKTKNVTSTISHQQSL